MLGIRSSVKEDIGASPADLVYGQSLTLPGEFFHNSSASVTQSNFVDVLRQRMRKLRPTPASHHSRDTPFVSKDLATTSHVFLRVDRVRRPLEQPYVGPYKVISRTNKVFMLDVDGKNITVSIDRLKPAYLDKDIFPPITQQSVPTENPELEQGTFTKSGRLSRPVVRFQL